MRTVTTITNYYTFDELSEEAKEKALENVCNETTELRNDILYEWLNDELAELFPKSKLKAQYQLCYCQGDGLNIFGKLNGSDLLEYLIDDLCLTSKEYESLLALVNRTEFSLRENYSYGYFMIHESDFYNELLDKDYQNECTEMIYEFSRIAQRKFEELCYEWKYRGYDFIYKPSKEWLVEEIEACELEFLEDGTRA